MAQNILIVGSTGVIGKHITKAIVEAIPKFGRVAILTSQDTRYRKAQHVDGLQRQGVDVLVGDLGSEKDVKKAYENIDTVVSCVGRSAIEKQIPLIQWAVESPSVKRFFPSEYGTDIEYGPESANEKPYQLKIKVRAFIKTIDTSELEYKYLVTGPYSDTYLESPLENLPTAGGFDVQLRKAVLLGDGKGKISFTSKVDTGRFVVAALRSDAARNATLKVNSFIATPGDILLEFVKQTMEQWHSTYTSLNDLLELEETAWKSGNPSAAVCTLRRIWTQGGTLYDEYDNGRLGIMETDCLRESVRSAIWEQKGQSFIDQRDRISSQIFDPPSSNLDNSP